jgi:hypothetical protein
MTKKELKAGDILSCTGKSLLSKAIKKISKSKYSHTALVVEIWGQLFIIDSQSRGTTIKTIKDWTKKYNYSYDISRPIEFTLEMKNRAIEKCGDTPYDFIGLIIFQPIMILTGKWLGKRGKKADKKLYCSEFISYVFEMPNRYSNTPQDVYDFTIKSKNFKII